jgi:transposase InsO family protein
VLANSWHLEEGASLQSNWPTSAGGEDGLSAECIEGFYNTRRRHSALRHLSPAEFEEIRLGDEDAA